MIDGSLIDEARYLADDGQEIVVRELGSTDLAPLSREVLVARADHPHPAEVGRDLAVLRVGARVVDDLPVMDLVGLVLRGIESDPFLGRHTFEAHPKGPHHLAVTDDHDALALALPVERAQHAIDSHVDICHRLAAWRLPEQGAAVPSLELAGVLGGEHAIRHDIEEPPIPLAQVEFAQPGSTLEAEMGCGLECPDVFAGVATIEGRHVASKPGTRSFSVANSLVAETPSGTVTLQKLLRVVTVVTLLL